MARLGKRQELNKQDLGRLRLNRAVVGLQCVLACILLLFPHGKFDVDFKTSSSEALHHLNSKEPYEQSNKYQVNPKPYTLNPKVPK